MSAVKSYVDHSRNELLTLRKQIDSYLASSSTYPLDKLENTLLKIIANITYGKDMSSLFPLITQVTQSKSILVKKLSYHFISIYASLNPELSLLTLNTLKKENLDSDPTIRALSLRTITSLSYADFGPLITSSVQNALVDKDAYVRKTAIICAYQCGFKSEMKTEYLKQVADKDFDVHLNSLRILNELGHFDKGLTKSVALHLLERLESADLPGRHFIISLLHKYKPGNSDELFTIMDVLDPFLNLKSFSIVFSTVSLFLSYSEQFPDYSQDILERCIETLLLILNSTHNRITNYSILKVIQNLLKKKNKFKKYFLEHFSKNWKLFIITYNNSINEIQIKLIILTKLVNENNSLEITNELISISKNFLNQKEMKGIRKMIFKALTKIALKLPNTLKIIMVSFVQFLELEINEVNEEIISFIVKILRNNKKHENVLLPLITPYLLSFESFEHKRKMLWFASRYFGSVEEAHFLLEEIVGQIYNIYKKKADKQLQETGRVKVSELNDLLLTNNDIKSIQMDYTEEMVYYNEKLMKVIQYKVEVMKSVCFLVFDYPQKMVKIVGALLELFLNSEWEHLIVKREAEELWKLIRDGKKEELKEKCDSNKPIQGPDSTETDTSDESIDKSDNKEVKEEEERFDELKVVLGFSPCNKFEEEVFENETHEHLFSSLKLENTEEDTKSRETDVSQSDSEEGGYEEAESESLSVGFLEMSTTEFQNDWESFSIEKSIIIKGLKKDVRAGGNDFFDRMKEVNLNVIANGVIDEVLKVYGCFMLGTEESDEIKEKVLFELLVSGENDTAKITVKVGNRMIEDEGLFVLERLMDCESK